MPAKFAYNLLRVATRKPRLWALSNILEIRIRRKWFSDKRKLPLTGDHWELYRNIHRSCMQFLREFPNLIECRDHNDRIQWLKLFDQSEDVIFCADKINVRSYVATLLDESHLPKLYQVADNCEDLDFDKLPNSFVIKTNHDSGTVIIVRNKDTADRDEIRKKLAKSLSRAFGWELGEWAYAFIQPKILVEELLDEESALPPPDYKFQCSEGRVKFTRYTYGRTTIAKEILLDRDGVDMGFRFDQACFIQGSGFIKPDNWYKIVAVAEKLSSKFKCVRVDLYNLNGRIVVGELTFFPGFGCYIGDGQRRVGHLLDFDRHTYKKPIYQKLDRAESLLQ